MKSVTAFVGSSRKKGLTFTAARQFLDNLESFGDVHGEIIFLSDYKIGVCRGCKSCFLKGEERCPLKDDRDVLIEKMMTADAVVFASPNYSFQVSGIVKVFFDRLGFVFHRPHFHGKTFTSIVAQGIYGGGKVVKYLDFVGGALGFNVTKGSCITSLEPMSEKDRGKMTETLAKHARRFHQRLLMPTHPVPSLFQLMAFRMARTSIRLTLRDDNRDYTYYREHGWFESPYYYPAGIGSLKKAVAFGFDRMAARIYQQKPV